MPRKRRKIPKKPRAIERRYAAFIRAVSRQASKEILRILKPQLARAKRADADLDLTDLYIDLTSIEVSIARIKARLSGNKTFDSILEAINEFSERDVFRVVGISISTEDPEVISLLAKWRRENVALVSSMLDSQVEGVRKLLFEGASTGMRGATLAKRLTERFRMSERKARIIATDQVLKANGNLTKLRHSQAGVREYIWNNSNDERVRDSHRDFNGRRFSWDDPPVAENGPVHPGEDILCRCIAIPVLE